MDNYLACRICLVTAGRTALNSMLEAGTVDITNFEKLTNVKVKISMPAFFSNL